MMDMNNQIDEILGLSRDTFRSSEQNRRNAIKKIFDAEILAKLSTFEEPEYIRELVGDQLKIFDAARKLPHREENGKITLIFGLAEVKRLRRLLNGLLNGSYYRSGDKPEGDDIKSVYKQDEVEFGLERIAGISHFYELRVDMLLEDISSDEYCDEELRLRSHPFDDPW
jgi:hypothetical protein